MVRTDHRGATSAGAHRSMERRSRWACHSSARWGRVGAMPGVSRRPGIPAVGISVKVVVNVGGSIAPASGIGINFNAVAIIGVVDVIRNSSSLLGVYVLVS